MARQHFNTAVCKHAVFKVASVLHTAALDTPSLCYRPAESEPGRLHFAILAPSEKAVQEYYNSALSAGGTDSGAPGPRDHYGPGGIGTFVTDLDNNNIEVCYHK